MEHRTHRVWAKALATIAVCGLGLGCMEITNSSTGVGWAAFGIFLIWTTK